MNDYELSDRVVDTFYRPYAKKIDNLIDVIPKQNIANIEIKNRDKNIVYLLYRTLKRSVKLFLKSFMIWRTWKCLKKELVDPKIL